MSGLPCSWALNPTCAGWVDYPAETKISAINYASLLLWSATGRRFGLCEITVRPCGRRTDNSSLWGYIQGDGGGFYPYLDNSGTWRNCACSGGCSCRPRCEVWLPGPVDSITSVTQDGVTVDPAAYRVDNRSWLVRTDGGCWPEYADLSTDTNRFEVTYQRGEPVPAVLIDAAETVACEFAKALTSQDCRLPARITSLTRQGVQMSALDTDSLTRRGFIGIPEVDQVIFAFNPFGLRSRPRVITPDLPYPRQVTG